MTRKLDECRMESTMGQKKYVVQMTTNKKCLYIVLSDVDDCTNSKDLELVYLHLFGCWMIYRSA
jgi:hypothetical protein